LKNLRIFAIERKVQREGEKMFNLKYNVKSYMFKSSDLFYVLACLDGTEGGGDDVDAAGGGGDDDGGGGDGDGDNYLGTYLETDIIKLKGGHCGESNPIGLVLCPYFKKGNSDRGTQEECHVKTEAESCKLSKGGQRTTRS
jgi:hypothetical protein